MRPDGELEASVGDPAQPAFLRSAAKPMQAVAMLTAGLEDDGIADADLALACASHGGFDVHVDRVAAWLGEMGLEVGALKCGAHPPLDEASKRLLEASGEVATALHNNCSGKHAAMLRTCQVRGWPLAAYVDDSHPLQSRIAAAVDRFCGTSPGAIARATDGCGVPTFRAPLAAAATAYARLAAPESLGDENDRRLADRVYGAMTAHPERVAGPGRFSTRLMEVGGGALLGKEGADGFYAIALRSPRPLGVALKIADGTEVCRDGVVLEVLRQLGALDAAQLGELEAFRVPVRRSCAGAQVGDVQPVVELKRS